jgi:four helix bundle protein
MSDKGFLPQKGNYRNLLSYQKSVIIYDCTFVFCERFFNKRDRTVDQMVQAARSGKQNIIEGTKAALTSTGTEIKLINVARASLEELLEDFHDFLRVRNLTLWLKDSQQASYVRKLSSGKIPAPKLHFS